MSTIAPPRPVRETRHEPRRARVEPEPRHLRVVDPPIHRGRRRAFAFLGFMLVFGILLFTVSFHVRLATGQQKIDRLTEEAAAAQTTYDRLRVEVDGLSAPKRIIARARALGLVEADDPTWLAPASPALDAQSGSSAPTLRDYLDVKPYLQGDP